MEYYDGQILKNSQEHKDFANWTNGHGNKFGDTANGDGTYTVYAIPPAPAPTHEEIAQIRASEYQAKVDPITAHISRLRDKEQTEEIVAEIEALIAERDALVEQIKAEHPYPDELEHSSEQVSDQVSEQVEQEPEIQE